MLRAQVLRGVKSDLWQQDLRNGEFCSSKTQRHHHFEWDPFSWYTGLHVFC